MPASGQVIRGVFGWEPTAPEGLVEGREGGRRAHRWRTKYRPWGRQIRTRAMTRMLEISASFGSMKPT